MIDINSFINPSHTDVALLRCVFVFHSLCFFYPWNFGINQSRLW